MGTRGTREGAGLAQGAARPLALRDVVSSLLMGVDSLSCVSIQLATVEAFLNLALMVKQ
jgi:hypothetical protein